MDCIIDNQEYNNSNCESGWTLYLEQSSSYSSYISDYNSQQNQIRNNNGSLKETEEEEEEDLSMVSDASSGPPHAHGEEGNEANACCYRYPVGETTRQKEKTRMKGKKDRSAMLDDTASSPLLDFSNASLKKSLNERENGLEYSYSQGYSSTRFQVRPSYPEHCNFFQTLPHTSLIQQNQWCGEKGW